MHLYGSDWHEQWRHSPLFTLQNSGDEEMQQKKKEEKEKEKEKGKSRLPCTMTMSGWRSKRRRPVVNWGSCLADGRRSFLFFLCFNSSSFFLSLLLSRGIIEVLRSLIFLQRVFFLFKNMCFVAKLICRWIIEKLKWAAVCKAQLFYFC